MPLRYELCCCICGKSLEGRNWLCNEHAKEWGIVGVPFRLWPQWLKVLHNQEKRERRKELREWGKTFPFCQSATGERKAYGEWLDLSDRK